MNKELSNIDIEMATHNQIFLLSTKIRRLKRVIVKD